MRFRNRYYFQKFINAVYHFTYFFKHVLSKIELPRLVSYAIYTVRQVLTEYWNAEILYNIIARSLG